MLCQEIETHDYRVLESLTKEIKSCFLSIPGTTNKLYTQLRL